jgi:hypothetical protein
LITPTVTLRAYDKSRTVEPLAPIALSALRRRSTGSSNILQLIQLGGLLHQFGPHGFELVRGLDMWTIARKANTALRLFAQVGRIDPDPGIWFSGIRHFV